MLDALSWCFTAIVLKSCRGTVQLNATTPFTDMTEALRLLSHRTARKLGPTPCPLARPHIAAWYLANTNASHDNIMLHHHPAPPQSLKPHPYSVLVLLSLARTWYSILGKSDLKVGRAVGGFAVDGKSRLCNLSLRATAQYTSTLQGYLDAGF
jgi:hypothetical protein